MRIVRMILPAMLTRRFDKAAKLVIEPDGSQHDGERNIKNDADRTVFPEGYGLKVLRIPQNDIDKISAEFMRISMLR